MPVDLKTLAQVREETPGLKEPGDWILINIQPHMSWPTVAQSFEFEEHELWLIPITEDASPGLAVRNPRLQRDEAHAMLYRALSVIAWAEDAGAIVESRGGGSPHFPQYGANNRSNFVQPDCYDPARLPKVTSEDAKLALALMREGRGLRHPAYSFLSFYRVIELAIPDGKQRGIWITGAVDRIEDRRANEALQELRKVHDGDVGTHLRDSGRSAVAHATKHPIANPDNPADYLRLHRELPIIEALAVMVVEEKLDVKTSHTVWREHLYELEGWKPIFGEPLIELITSGGSPKPGHNLEIPSINICLRRTGAYAPLENLRPTGWDVHECKGVVQFESRNGLVSVYFLLDFVNERLIFESGRSLGFKDDGTVEAAKTGKELAKFFQDWNANGELQIWDVDHAKLLSRCDAFIPVNVMFNPDGAKAELEGWDNEIVRRARKVL